MAKTLVPGDILHQPGGWRDWVVVESDDSETRLACVSKYMVKSTEELTGWELIENGEKE